MATNLKSIHLFAGAGGGILADLLLGHRPICAVEIERYPRDILLMRQADGILPRFPVWDDVRTFRSDNPECARQFDAYRSIRDELVICGGFPCQDISIAGKGAGIDGERSGLWSEYARIVCEIRPRYVFVENSPMLASRGLGRVLGDLAALGYDAAWGVLGAGHYGAWHLRKRIWLVATNSRKERIQGEQQGEIPRQFGVPWSQDVRGVKDLQGRPDIPSPQLCGVRHGVANYVERISALGNGQVPIVAASAFAQLHHALTKAKPVSL